MGILTYNADKLNFKHLEQLGVPSIAQKRVHIVGAPSDGLLQNLVREKGPYHHDGMTKELCDAAKDLVARVPSIKALILECTQMPPFAEAIQQALGGQVIVYDVHTMGCWFYSGLVRKGADYWRGNDS